MQHEREPLGRRQRLEHDEHGDTDRVREQRLVLGIAGGVDADDGLRQPRAGVVLVPRAPGPQHVEAHARDDRRQPTAEVLDLGRVGAVEA